MLHSNVAVACTLIFFAQKLPIEAHKLVFIYIICVTGIINHNLLSHLSTYLLKKINKSKISTRSNKF